MARLNCLAWIIVGILALGNGAAAAEFPLNRDWVGRFNVSATVFGGPSVSDRVNVPSLLESILDDEADTYTIESLEYADGGENVNRLVSANHVLTVNPSNFPEPVMFVPILEFISLERVEWLNVPSYANVDPVALFFHSGNTWSAQPEAPTPTEPILLRLVGQYEGEVPATPDVIVSFDETIELDPGSLSTFLFNTGNNYPETLFFGANRSIAQGNSVDLTIPIGPFTRTLRLSAQFVHVPEPGTIALTLICCGALGFYCRRTAHRRIVAA